MRILLVGHGAREHAMAESLARSRHQPKLYAYMGTPNPGIIRLCAGHGLGSLSDVNDIATYARKKRIDLAVVGPESPLVSGVVDRLQADGINTVGPPQVLARLEGDKFYLRTIMQHCAPEALPRFSLCITEQQARATIAELGSVAVKPTGLTGGKGVKVSGKHLANTDETLAYARELIEHEGQVLIEKRLEGEEFSLMAFSDGTKLMPMPLVQDYKQAYEGDQGPMTGGMGSYSCPDHLLPFVTKEERDQAFAILCRIINRAQKETNTPYHGFVYGQFMLTGAGPKVVEVNVRLGDPEAMNVLGSLQSDFVDICIETLTGLRSAVAFEEMATVCKYLVPIGYPETPGADQLIQVDREAVASQGVQLFYASVRAKEDKIYTTRSRALALMASGPTVEEAEARVEAVIADIEPGHLYHRSDIAKPEALRRKATRMQSLRVMASR